MGFWGEHHNPLPAGVQLWPKLEHLDISSLEVYFQPDWFTGLTSLQRLIMRDCDFACFPVVALEMSQLHVLSFANMRADFLPKKMTECASWPNLSVLDLTLHSNHEWDLECHVVLLLGMNAFKVAGRSASLVINEEYTV